MHKPLDDFHQQLQELLVSACTDHQEGRLAAAEAVYLQLLDSFAELPVLHYNLGLIDYSLERYEEACRRFTRAAELQPGDGDILFNLALSRKRCGELAGAITCFRQLLQSSPDCIDSLYNLAGCLQDSGELPAAVATYRQVLARAPEHYQALSNLAYLLHRLGQREEALCAYRRVVELRPDHIAAGHMLAALSGWPADTPPEAYVREVFDNYSAYFEQSLLAELEYCVPEKLRVLYEQSRVDSAPCRHGHGLDLGCGTGLGGQAFADCCHRLDGLDLSAKMIALAAGKGLYRQLHQRGIAPFLAENGARYDLFLATDVFVYLGELRQIFALLRQRARPGAVLLFSTESLAEGRFLLRETGRFAHAASYIEELAAATGWLVLARQESRLRKERGDWVPGDLWHLRLAGGCGRRGAKR